MELTTERLVLRSFRADDHGAVHAFAGDPEVVRWMDWGPGFALLSETESPRTAYKLAVIRAADGALIGAVELHVESREHRRGTMGYLIRGEWRDRLLYAQVR